MAAWLGAIVLSLLLCAYAQAAQPATAPAALALPHVRLDLQARRVEFDARVVFREGPLELLVCTEGSKEHESVLATPARPSDIHAALLRLGLAPGRPAYWTATPDGQPLAVPPMGAEVAVRLRYRDEAGQEHTVTGQEWMRMLADGSPARATPWIFVGSETLPDGQYLADSTGEVVCVANFPSALLDVPFESSRDNALLDFEADTAAIPPLGTPVTVVLEPLAGAAEAPVARAVLAVDRFGHYRVEGLEATPEQLARWAEAFQARHARPYVVVHAAPRALVWDVQRLRSLLADARITDVEVQMTALAGEVLPRTPAQARAALDAWAARFADYRELIHEPGRQAEVVLRQIELRRAELEALRALWADYGVRLEQSLKAYRSTTQPAAGQEARP